MAKIIIGGAGGAPSENVIRSLMEGDSNEEIIGIGSEVYDLVQSKALKKLYIPYSYEKNYKNSLIKLLNKEKADLIHFQNDVEILQVSRMRDEILQTGTKLYMPRKEVIENCVDKEKSYNIWKANGINVPKTMLIKSQSDLKKAFELLGDNEGNIWLRETVGGGGKGALPTNNYEFARLWIDKFNGWGKFTAAELLTPNSVTWLSIWYRGELVVAQTRKRRSWSYGNRTLSGVTGVTAIGETCSDDVVTKVSMDSIKSIDYMPHGIYAVDMTYDRKNFPNPTEINISRFFTTVYFFTKAGLNMPKIFKDIVLYNEFPSLTKKINPLKDGLLWLRSMDKEPMLTTEKEIDSLIIR